MSDDAYHTPLCGNLVGNIILLRTYLTSQKIHTDAVQGVANGALRQAEGHHRCHQVCLPPALVISKALDPNIGLGLCWGGHRGVWDDAEVECRSQQGY